LWGLGHDSIVWASLNKGGRTVFLENIQEWIDVMQPKLPPGAEVYRFDYQLNFFNSSTNEVEEEWRNFTQGPGGMQERGALARAPERWLHTSGAFDGTLDEATRARLHSALPAALEADDWDVILVDSPGQVPHTRAESVWNTARVKDALLARGRPFVHVLLHDCERHLEADLADHWLGRAPHFVTVAGHRRNDRPSRLRHYTYVGEGAAAAHHELKQSIRALAPQRTRKGPRNGAAPPPEPPT
jgi:hypothetical protein